MARTKKLYILVGLPGSGKTTWARSFLESEVVDVISTDDIRDELHPGIQHDGARNAEVFDLFHHRLATYLAMGLDVVADATSMKRAHRNTLYSIADKYGAQVHLVIFTNIDQAVTRNTARVREVPEPAMVGFAGQYERMLSDIKTEPHDSLTHIAYTS